MLTDTPSNAAFRDIETPWGSARMWAADGALIRLEWTLTGRDSLPGEENLLDLAEQELEEFVWGERREFTVPLRPVGTQFQHLVWAALLQIPYGQTRSYLQIADGIGKPGAVRAVGAANGRNPISIFIPCHRVIGANGSLTGYAGGLAMKRELLALERHPAGNATLF